MSRTLAGKGETMPIIAKKKVPLQGEGHSQIAEVKSLLKIVRIQHAGWHQIWIGSKNQGTK